MFCILVLGLLCLAARDNTMQITSGMFGSGAVVDYPAYKPSEGSHGASPAFSIRATLSTDLGDHTDSVRMQMPEACAEPGTCLRYNHRCGPVTDGWRCDYKISLSPREWAFFRFRVTARSEADMNSAIQTIGVIPRDKVQALPLSMLSQGGDDWN